MGRPTGHDLRTLMAKASTLDGLLMGAGDAVIGVNPAGDDPQALGELVSRLDEVIARFAIPTQSCVLTHATTA